LFGLFPRLSQENRGGARRIFPVVRIASIGYKSRLARIVSRP
jgi:hypothetical protein